MMREKPLTVAKLRQVLSRWQVEVQGHCAHLSSPVSASMWKLYSWPSPSAQSR